MRRTTRAPGPNRCSSGERALDLLREAMESLPEAQRPDFWRRNVEHDAALNPVRATAEFRGLAAAYAAGPP